MSSFDSGKKLVMIVDDNPGDARLIQILLEESDLAEFQTLTRDSLEAAFDALSEKKEFAAILLDLTLPDSTGIETVERILARYPNNNVIVMTGFADKNLGLKAVQAGAQDFLVKGMFDSDQLAKSLRFSMQRAAILNRLEETQRIAHIGNWEWQERPGQLDASDEVFKIFGLEASQVGMHHQILEDSDHPFHFFQKIHAETLEKGHVKQDYFLPASASRPEKFVFVQCQLENTGKGRVFQGVIQDITERKKAEREMLESRERYLQIFTQSKDAIYIGTLDGKMVDCNQAALELFQLDKKALKALPNIHRLFKPVERSNELLLKIRFQQSVRDFEIEVEQANGERRQCLVSANYQVEDGKEGYNAIIRDITERKQTEELIKARDLARQSARLKEQFIASISHEMRTPMNGILGMTNLLENSDLNDEQKELVFSIQQSSEVLLGIVNDILEIATIQNGKVFFENKPFSLQDLLENLLKVMDYKAKEKDLLIRLEVDPDIPEQIIGDKLRLNQILFNLVGNAIKFTDEGWVHISVVKLNDFEGGVQLKFEVQDTGIGIPKDKMEAVFESFTRIRTKDRLYEGTGLGLSISKSLVEQQGGKIGAQSEVGQGSKFYFDLIFEVPSGKEEAPVEHQLMELDPNRQYQILLVEDHKMNQIVARKTLLKKWPNLQIMLAENGEEALKMMEAKEFDLVLMDIQMPVLDGYEATAAIRRMADPQKSQIPVIAMTAHAHLSKEGKFKSFGLNDFVVKPFQPDQLFAKIALYLNQKASV